MTRSIRNAPSLLLLMISMIPIAAPPYFAAQPAPRLQAYFASDFTDKEYQKKAYSTVASLWTMPAEMPAEGNKAVVVVVILRDGTGSELRLHMESGSKAWDDAAIAAVKNSIPFAALPKAYGRDSVEVHFHFLYTE